MAKTIHFQWQKTFVMPGTENFFLKWEVNPKCNSTIDFDYFNVGHVVNFNDSIHDCIRIDMPQSHDRID